MDTLAAETRPLSQLVNRLNFKRQAAGIVEQKVLRRRHPPRVICLSQTMKDVAVRIFGINPERLTVLHNGIDLNRFDPDLRPAAREQLRQRLGIESHRTVVLFVAQDFALKGLAESIAAIARLKDRPMLLVVGQDDPRPYRDLANKLGMAQDLVFAGAASDTYDFYRAADFLLYPSRRDSFGLVVAEAVAMGLPVMVTRQAGASEIIRHGIHGIVLPQAGDEAAMETGLRQLLDPDIRAWMSRACLDLRAELSHERHLDRLVELYQQLAAQSAAGGAAPDREYQQT